MPSLHMPASTPYFFFFFFAPKKAETYLPKKKKTLVEEAGQATAEANHNCKRVKDTEPKRLDTYQIWMTKVARKAQH
jgi:hypothetical protein